jgi:hypothetical protein
MILRASLKPFGKSHTWSCYLPPQELRSLDSIPGFTPPKSNTGHWILESPPQNHIHLHQTTPVSQWKTSNIFSKGTHQKLMSSFSLFVGCLYSCPLYLEYWFVDNLSSWVDMAPASSLKWQVSHPVCPASCALLTLIACAFSEDLPSCPYDCIYTSAISGFSIRNSHCLRNG